MTLTPTEIDRIKSMYARMTIRDLASQFGVSPANMGQILSRNGISKPGEEQRQRTRTYIERFYGRKGEATTIAQYLGMSIDALRMRVKRMGLTAGQTRLPL